jgi:hypothetical protein
MKRFPVYTLLIIMFLLPVIYGQLGSVRHQQSNCVNQIVHDAEILAHKQLDVNRDGVQDDVIIYGAGDLYVLVVANRLSAGCKVILNDWLTSRHLIDETKVVKVQQIELVDLTGDIQPELHVGLDLSAFAFRASEAVHAIYKLQNESMERVFVLSQCLQMSSFEFRTASDGTILIYLDEDRHCAGGSSSRNYAIYRWNAETSQFESLESGKIAKETPDPFWNALLEVCVLPPIAMIFALAIVGGLIVWQRSKKKHAKANTNSRI